MPRPDFADRKLGMSSTLTSTDKIVPANVFPTLDVYGAEAEDVLVYQQSDFGRKSQEPRFLLRDAGYDAGQKRQFLYSKSTIQQQAPICDWMPGLVPRTGYTVQKRRLDIALRAKGGLQPRRESWSSSRTGSAVAVGSCAGRTRVAPSPGWF
jgi:hypothetical protein